MHKAINKEHPVKTRMEFTVIVMICEPILLIIAPQWFAIVLYHIYDTDEFINIYKYLFPYLFPVFVYL